MLIGLTGRAGAGKDTVYEMLATLYGGQTTVERRAFADPLYVSAAAALGVTSADLRRWKNDPEAQVYAVAHGGILARQSVRSYLQRYGTEAHRDVFGHHFWTDAVDLEHRGRIVAVTDVRFPNEAEAVVRAGGHVALVVGPDTGPPTHASERPLPGNMVDFVIHNEARNDDRAYLRQQVATVVTRIRRLHGEMP